MKTLRHYRLGETYSGSPHDVVSCLPTMADVRGYEEGDRRVHEALSSGYPRFVVHEFVAELARLYRSREALGGGELLLVAGRPTADDLIETVGGGVAVTEVAEELFCLYTEAGKRETIARVRAYAQHTGCRISSRHAEDLLVASGAREQIFAEESARDATGESAARELAALVGCSGEDVALCSSGMNAFYSAFRSAQRLQAARGRTVWLQVGWLYLDSGRVIQEFLAADETLEHCWDASDTDTVVAAITRHGESLACVVLECPTNPLLQVPDLEPIAQAARECGALLIVDPTIASVYNVDVLPYCDLLTTSLTKYAAHEGDVMIGAVAVNPSGSHRDQLADAVHALAQPPYRRDLCRLAHEMRSAPQAVERMNARAGELAGYLESHPAIRAVHHAGGARELTRLSRGSAAGAVVTIELAGSLDAFYDALATMKGPSFGTDYTLVCPFLYLAHYDLVSAAPGRRFLESVGLDPELVRISAGTEPIDELIEVFDRALAASMR